jgi:hypothetical protein
MPQHDIGRLAAMPTALAFQQFCMEHNTHLMIKRQLVRMGAKHWGDIAKVINVWRGGTPPRNYLESRRHSMGDNVQCSVVANFFRVRYGVVGFQK